jgi:hypothetical protein
MSMTVHDLMMLENQIPFFVVEKLYEMRYGNEKAAVAAATTTRRRIRQQAWKTIQDIVGGVPSAPNPNDDPDLEFQHLVHVCHVYPSVLCPLP